MPDEVLSETLELGRTNTINNALDGSGMPRIRVVPIGRLMPRTDNYDEEDSDSSSDDEGPFSPESNEAPISRFEDSRNSEKTENELTTLVQTLSIKSDTSVDSIVPGGRDRGAWRRSSSEGSPASSTSLSCSDSDSESSEDEEGPDLRENYRKNLDEKKRDHNSNYETRSKTDNDEKYEFSSTRNIPVPSKNEESDDPASCDDSSDDDSSDDDSEDDSEIQAIPRGPMREPYYHNSNKPYDRPSPRYESSTEPLTPEDGSSYTRSTFFSPQNEESDHTSDDNSNDNNTGGEVEAECELVAKELMETHPEMFNNIIIELEKLADEFSGQSPNENSPIYSATGSDGDNNTNSLPSILINDNIIFPTQLPQNTTFGTVDPPLSSASSSNSFEHYVFSPGYCVTDTQPGIQDPIHSSIFLTPNHTPPQNASPTYPLNHVTLGDVGNRTSPVYTQFPAGVGSIQGNVNVCQSDFYTIPDIETGTQAQTSPSQITNDLFLCDIAPPTQHQSNLFQYQPATIEPFNGFQRKLNSLSTSRGGIMQINPKDKVDIKMNITGLEVQTVNCNGSKSRKTGSKETKKKTIPTVPPLMLSTIEDDPHLPTILNTPSPDGKKSTRTIAPWSLSRLPSTSAVDRLRREVHENDAQAAMCTLFEYTYDDYKEQNDSGDTYLMSIVRDPTKLASHLAHITPVLDKMAMIPESLIIRNKKGHDALYLAAINCPGFDYVTGVIAATIAKSCKSNDIWHRKYDREEQTLLHALAARGDSHVSVLRELLGVEKALERTLFDLSAKNIHGQTPLHVAAEAHVGVKSVDVVRLLMDRGANPMVTDSNYGNTPLHMAMSNKSCIGIVQALLRNGGGKAVNISNRVGNTPLHLAASLLNNASQKTQNEICWQLITAGGQTNIRNQQNKTPLSYVAEDRRDMIQKIFYRKL